MLSRVVRNDLHIHGRITSFGALGSAPRRLHGRDTSGGTAFCALVLPRLASQIACLARLARIMQQMPLKQSGWFSSQGGRVGWKHGRTQSQRNLGFWLACPWGEERTSFELSKLTKNDNYELHKMIFLTDMKHDVWLNK